MDQRHRKVRQSIQSHALSLGLISSKRIGAGVEITRHQHDEGDNGDPTIVEAATWIFTMEEATSNEHS
jgi:hypothetical protein